MNVPHSIAVWLIAEVNQRNPDGHLSGMPVGNVKRHSVTLHCKDKIEAERLLEKIFDEVKEKIENVSL